jgi:hypothetical protein
MDLLGFGTFVDLGNLNIFLGVYATFWLFEDSFAI